MQPPATTPFTATSDGGEKKVEKKLPKNLEGVGVELYICSEEGGIIIGCAGDYALMLIAPAADGGSSDSSGNMRL